MFAEDCVDGVEVCGWSVSVRMEWECGWSGSVRMEWECEDGVGV